MYEKALLAARKKLQKSDTLSDFWLWANAIWKTSRGDPLEFGNRKYLVDIYKDQYPNIAIMKSAQTGISEYLISEAVFVCDQLGKKVLFTFPTQSHLNDFVQDRLDPVLFNSEYLKKRMQAAEKYVQKVGLKKIGDGTLYMRGSTNEKQLITIDADIVYLDERDRFDQKSIPYIDKRTLASDMGWRREVSTPTFPGNAERQNNIHGVYLASDQRIWQIKCESCGTWQELDFFKNLKFKSKEIVCHSCGKPIDRMKDGRWLPQNPESDVHGYKVSGMYNPFLDAKDLLKKYYQAKGMGISAMQQFYNQVLGVAYETEGDSLSEKDVDACMRDYEVPVPHREVSSCYAGADIGSKDTPHHVIVSEIKGDRTRYVWTGTVDKFFGPENSIQMLIDRYNIKCLVVDARPETTKVAELIEKYPGRVFGAYYPTAKFSIDEYVRWDDFKNEVNLDRTPSLDYLVSDIRNQRVEFPSNAGFISGFYDQMTAPIRVVERNNRTGTDEAKWREGSVADHFFHAANYDRIARLKGSSADALLDYYKAPVDEDETNMMRWLKLKGQRIF